jgi:hypothetical protein
MGRTKLEALKSHLEHRFNLKVTIGHHPDPEALVPLTVEKLSSLLFILS